MLPKTAFAMVQTDRRRLEPRDIAMPEIDDDSAILRVEACGICGSDYEQYEGVLGTPVPAVPGHEPLGRIAAIGDGAARRYGTRMRVSKKRAFYSMLEPRKIFPESCSECYYLCGYQNLITLHPNAKLRR